MPYTAKAHRFFALCATHPEKARGKCPERKQARAMMREGVKRSKRESNPPRFPKADSHGFF